jgi:hypothetical protein
MLSLSPFLASALPFRAQSMFASQCLFCGHGNPAGAKFCNDCASPLQLKKCKQCDAINDRPATNCYECGAEFPPHMTETEASSAALTAAAEFASSASGDGDAERGHTQLSQRASKVLGVLQRPSDNKLARAYAHDVKVVAREMAAMVRQDGVYLMPATQFETSGSGTASDRPLQWRERVMRPLFESQRRLIRGVTPFFFSVEQRATYVIPVRDFVATAQRSRIARVALSALLVAALALSSYYVYRHPQSDTGGGSSAIRTLSSAVPAKTGVSTTVSVGTVGMSTEATSELASPAASASDVTGPQVKQGRIRPTEPAKLDTEALTPAQSLAAAPSQTADTVGVGPRPATPVATESRRKAMPAAGQQIVPKEIPSNRSTATYPDPLGGILMRPRAAATAVRIAPATPRARACTEAVAALGLCNPDTKAESK